MSLLHVLRLVADAAIADRAQHRLSVLGAQAVAQEDTAPVMAELDGPHAIPEEDRTIAGAPSYDSIEARAADFVSAQVSAWSSTNPISLTSLASSYADEVFYYGARKSRQAIFLEKRRLLERWPERIYDVQPGSITVNVSLIFARWAEWWIGKRAAFPVRHQPAASHSLNMRSLFHLARSASSAKMVQ
jgi:hypothetical protein